MHVKRAALFALLVGLLLQTGCCRMCRRWCCNETTHMAPAPMVCCPPACCQPCCPQPAGYAPAGYAPQPYAGQPDCCTNACTTPAPATGVAPVAAPAGNQWQRGY